LEELGEGVQPVPVKSYQEVFNPNYNDYHFQKGKLRLILAEKKGSFLQPGSPLCDSRGRPFYYSTQLLGCPFHCHYCYLGGLYPSGYLVLFLNWEKLRDEVMALPPGAFLAISYESDLLGVERLFRAHHFWVEIGRQRPDLLIESRTKSANHRLLPEGPPPNFILTTTLTPNPLRRWEERIPPVEKRIEGVKIAREKGYQVEVAIEPVVRFPGYRLEYRKLEELIGQELGDIPIHWGEYRIPSQLLKRLRKRVPSPVNYYPFRQTGGVAHYPPPLSPTSYPWGSFSNFSGERPPSPPSTERGGESSRKNSPN
jgi:spore photoproduct lyase